jgi:Family of unknown function (DUF5681)
MTAPQTTSASYEVGYRKPPRHTQFQKGQSGNPGGRPRRSLAGRLEELALYEAYRTTVVMEDGHAMPMPAIQAVLRRQLESAAGGNVRAQRDILAMIRDIERARSVAALFEDGGADDAVVDDDDVVYADDADANDGDGNGVDDGAGSDDNDADDADHHDAGGPHNDEPARQQADGIDTCGERRQAEQEPTAPPAVSAPQPENAAAPPAGRTPSLPSGSGSAQRRRVRPRRSGAGRSAHVQPARPQPGRRRRSPAVNAGRIPGGHSGSSRRSPGRRNADPARPRLQAGTPARRPPLPNETKN